MGELSRANVPKPCIPKGHCQHTFPLKAILTIIVINVDKELNFESQVSSMGIVGSWGVRSPRSKPGTPT